MKYSNIGDFIPLFDVHSKFDQILYSLKGFTESPSLKVKQQLVLVNDKLQVGSHYSLVNC